MREVQFCPFFFLKRLTAGKKRVVFGKAERSWMLDIEDQKFEEREAVDSSVSGSEMY